MSTFIYISKRSTFMNGDRLFRRCRVCGHRYQWRPDEGLCEPCWMKEHAEIEVPHRSTKPKPKPKKSRPRIKTGHAVDSVLAWLRENEPGSRMAMAEDLGLEIVQVHIALQTLRREGLVVNLSRGVWSVAERPAHEVGDSTRVINRGVNPDDSEGHSS